MEEESTGQLKTFLQTNCTKACTTLMRYKICVDKTGCSDRSIASAVLPCMKISSRTHKLSVGNTDCLSQRGVSNCQKVCDHTISEVSDASEGT